MENRHSSRPSSEKKEIKQSTTKPVQEAAVIKDDSIRVITRKAPAQKYASFEDFMKSQK